METKFNFKSAICTSREQSGRLLSLGLKKETADCGHFYGRQEYDEYEDWETVILDGNWQPYWDVTDKEIPAWSLHRLIEMCDINPFIFYTNCGYDNVVDRIEELIKEGYFPKEYLV